MRRKFFIFFSILILCSGSLFVFRYHLFAIGTKFALKKSFSKTLSLREVVPENKKVKIRGLNLKEDQFELTLDEVEYQLDFKQLFSSSSNLLNLYSLNLSHWMEILIPMKQYGIDLNVKKGVLKCGNQNYYLKFTHSEKKHEIGILTLFYDPTLNSPFLTLHFHLRGEQLITGITLEEISGEHFLQLASLVSPKTFEHYENAKGKIHLNGSAIFDKNGFVDEFSTRFTCENFEIANPHLQLSFQSKKLNGELNYPEGIESESLPLWKKMQCDLNLDEGKVYVGEKLTLSNLKGNLVFDPRENPSLNLRGILAEKENPLALQLEGKGAIQDERAYWLEFVLNLDDRKGTRCESVLSICRPEIESFIVQLEAGHLYPSQVEMLKKYFARSFPRLNEWEVKEGKFQGKLVTFFEKGKLAHFEIQDLIGKEVAITSGSSSLFFKNLKGEGRLFDILNFDVEMTTGQLLSFASEDLKKIYSKNHPNEMAHVAMKVQFGEKDVETSAHVDFLNLDQSLQFGFKSKQPFPHSLEEVSEGWVHSEKITQELYAPFVHAVDKNLEIQGNLDLLLTFHGKTVELAIQIEDFLSKHLLFDLKADAIGEKGKTSGRVRLTYDLSSHTLFGKIPLVNAKGYEKQYGLYFDHLNGELTFAPKQISGQMTDGEIYYDRQCYLKKIKFDFSLGEKKTITNLLAQLALSTDKEYLIQSPKLDASVCEVHLLDGKEKLATFNGQKGEIWEGALSLKGEKESFNTQFGFDPLTNFAILDVSGANTHLLCKKNQGAFHIETFEWKGKTFKGVVTKSGEGFSLSQFEMDSPDFEMKGEGKFSIGLPRRDQELIVKSDLELEGEIKTSDPVRLSTSHPVKIAFSPNLGLVVSNLNIQGEGCEVGTEHLEYLVSNGKISGNKCSFKLSDQILSTFFKMGALPGQLSDFQMNHGLSGEVNFGFDNGSTDLQGILQTEKGSLVVGLKWRDQKGEFNLSEEGEGEKLTFHAHFDNEGILFDSIKGSLRGLNADLKKNGTNQLKGIVKVDFSEFNRFFQFPFNEHLSTWKVGSGYQLEGIFTPEKRLQDWTFRGKIKGRNFNFGGMQLKSFESNLEIEKEQIVFENLDLSDEAGKMWIDEGRFVQSDASNQWYFSFPLIEIRNFHPSFLHYLEGPEKQITPLMIKSATLRDLKGKIDDLSTLTGHGTLRFTNYSKKGEKYIPKNLPYQVLERLGLQETLFVPASGELEYIIQNNRCYLRNLQAVMSERRQSEFYPPRNGVIGFVDFDGNFFIDLQVRQHVVRTIHSPLSLQVRGTWGDPELIIK